MDVTEQPLKTAPAADQASPNPRPLGSTARQAPCSVPLAQQLFQRAKLTWEGRGHGSLSAPLCAARDCQVALGTPPPRGTSEDCQGARERPSRRGADLGEKTQPLCRRTPGAKSPTRPGTWLVQQPAWPEGLQITLARRLTPPVLPNCGRHRPHCQWSPLKGRAWRKEEQ